MIGHYCRICGLYRANEHFSGKGHAAHICKQCAKLPTEKRKELQTLTRIENLPFHLSRDKRAWLEKMRMDKSEIIRAAAEMAYEMRFVRHEELPDADEWEDSLTEDDLPF